MLLQHQAILQVLQDIHTHQAGAAAVQVLIITGILAVVTDHQEAATDHQVVALAALAAQAMVAAEVAAEDIAGKNG